MGGALSTLLSLTLSGSVLIVLLLALMPPLRDKLGHSGQYYLWLAPLARLLIPVFPAVRLPEGLSQALPGEMTAGALWLRAPDMALARPCCPNWRCFCGGRWPPHWPCGRSGGMAGVSARWSGRAVRRGSGSGRSMRTPAA